ncbi:MAG: hypothetical protein D3906_13450 [Candidatus Electrothrix sp. AUS1_2]|nr:hypothetical protein [Candidatus Electrothrix sp. AUS1_2]
MSKGQVSEIINWVRENNPSTCKEIADKIKKDYSIKYSIEGVRVLLKRHGLTFSPENCSWKSSVGRRTEKIYRKIS